MLNVTFPHLQDNLFEWHFSVRGPPDSDFDGGIYHGRIVLPPEYPMKPPSIILLTVRYTCTNKGHIQSHPIIQPLKRSRKTSNQMIKEWKMDRVSFNPQPFLVASHVVAVVRTKPGLSSQKCKRYCTGLVRILDCLIIFRQLYDTCTNDSLLKARVF